MAENSTDASGGFDVMDAMRKVRLGIDQNTVDPGIAQNVRVRLAGCLPGTTAFGEEQLDADLKSYLSLEEETMQWRDKLCAAIESKVPEEIDKALQIFEEKGGHGSRWTEEEARYLWANGGIALLEWMRSEQEGYIPIGSSSFLQSVLTGRENKRQEIRPSGKKGVDLFPYYNMQDLLIDEADQRKVLDSPHCRAQFCRITVLENIDDQPLRNIALATYLKLAVLTYLQKCDRNKATLNIGRVHDDESDEDLTWNAPSLGHNTLWVKPWGWRRNKCATPLEGSHALRWGAFSGGIDRARPEMLKRLHRRGWYDCIDVEGNISRTAQEMQQYVENLIGSHEHRKFDE